MTAQTYIEQLDTEAAGEALSALCVLGKTRAGREEINGLLGDRLPLHRAAQSPTPKVRKNAYRLMGALEDERDLPVLRTALQKEETLFAIPSLILALGRLGDEATLRAYEPPASPSPETDGLVAQIVLARDKALQSFETYGAEQITRLPAPRKVLCYAPEGFLDVLMEELRSLGFSAKAEHRAAAVITDRIGQVYKANCMAEALLPIAFDVPLDAQIIAQQVGPMPAERYRIELRGYTRDRRKLITALAGALPGQNNPSAYDTELRVDCHMDKADLYWKLWNVKDGRYPWRQRTVSASIHPATAFCLARYAMRFEKRERPRVLDPFCGCGSLLFARETLGPCRVLVGVDKSGAAVESAREVQGLLRHQGRPAVRSSGGLRSHPLQLALREPGGQPRGQHPPLRPVRPPPPRAPCPRRHSGALYHGVQAPEGVPGPIEGPGPSGAEAHRGRRAPALDICG